jgi:ABC-type antimicrobial peptide transport system permease subunit
METLRNKLIKQPGIENISLGLTSASSGDHWTTPLTYSGDGSQLVEIMTDVRVGDEHYIPTYGIALLAGRNVYPCDTIREIVVNEEFVSKMGLTNANDAVGKTVKLFGEKPVTIVGVTKNYNMSSLHEPIIPMFISPSVRSYRTMSVKINMLHAQETIERIRRAWSQAYPEYVFEYAFLNETIARFYEREQTVSRLFFLFSIIAVTISGLGLFGLITFMANRRTKEIGIRKVLGATVTDILSMMTREYILLILAAFIIATPLMYYLMSQWLGNFAYKISMGIDIFLVALTVTLFITLITIGYRAIKAATADPVKSLRYE